MLSRPGLQAERTGLSWTRVSLAFLVNGGLLSAQHGLRLDTFAMHEAITIAAFALALVTALIAFRRRRVLARKPLPANLAARLPLLGLGLGTLLFGAIVSALLLISFFI